MLTVLLAALGFMILAFAMFSVRLLFVKNGEFKGTCANNNPMLVEEGAVCGVCGKKAGNPCEGN